VVFTPFTSIKVVYLSQMPLPDAAFVLPSKISVSFDGGAVFFLKKRMR